MKYLILCVFLTATSVSAFEFTVLHTNDLHSYFEGAGPDMSYTSKRGDGDIVKGHYARLAYQIKKERSESKGPILLLDAGDFFAGTLFHALAPNKKLNVFPEAEFFKFLNYDATTFGNHEFDARDDGLLIMLEKWAKRDVKTPIVSTNAIISSGSPLHKFSDSIIKHHLIKVIEKDGKKLRVGIIGMLGPDGSLVSLGTRKDVSFIGFEDSHSDGQMDKLVALLQIVTEKIKRENNLDIIIALFHGGHPEDEEILRKVPLINLMIAGHTHKVYPKPIEAGNAILVQAGSFGRFLGKLNLKWDGKKLRASNKDTIIDIDDSIPSDPEMEKAILGYKKELDNFLSETGLSYDTFIFTSQEDLKRKAESLNPMGVMVTSAVREQANKSLKEPIDAYFSALGLVRKDIDKGHSYQLSDIFKILAIGFDENLEPGPKVVSFYLSKKEFFHLINFMETYAMMSAKFTPVFSNTVSYHNRWWGIPFLNKLGDLKLNGKNYDDWPDFIHVATNQFVAAYLPKVGAMSYGMLEFVPKDKNGRPTEPRILKEKEFVLLAKYLREQNKN